MSLHWTKLSIIQEQFQQQQKNESKERRRKMGKSWSKKKCFSSSPRRLNGRTRTATLILQLSSEFGGIFAAVCVFFVYGARKASRRRFNPNLWLFSSGFRFFVVRLCTRYLFFSTLRWMFSLKTFAHKLFPRIKFEWIQRFSQLSTQREQTEGSQNYFTAFFTIFYTISTRKISRNVFSVLIHCDSREDWLKGRQTRQKLPLRAPLELAAIAPSCDQRGNQVGVDFQKISARLLDLFKSSIDI